MSLDLLQTMQWTKLCWDLSFKDVIDLEDILPKTGQVYPVSLDNNEDHAQAGKALILWRPPHSELNGWEDKRPSEILKSFVIEGELYKCVTGKLDFSFKVTGVTPLTGLIEGAPPEEVSPLSLIARVDGSSALQWGDARYLAKARVGPYWYLFGSESETNLEAILSYHDNRMCIHYSATLHIPSCYETRITRYYLDSNEQALFNRLLDQAEDITEQDPIVLEADRIRGAEYY